MTRVQALQMNTIWVNTAALSNEPYLTWGVAFILFVGIYFLIYSFKLVALIDSEQQQKF